MKILVTGGAGRIGTELCKAFQEDYDLRVIDTEEPADLPEGAEFIKCDITCFEEVSKAVEGVDAIAHLAAIPWPMEDSAPLVMQVNALGTYNLLEAAARHGVEKFVMSSSDATVGLIFAENAFLPEYLPIDEAHPLSPQDSYGLSKLIGEEMCKAYSRSHYINTVCLRHCSVWHVEEYRDRDNLIKDPQTALGLWAYIDVRDVIQAYKLALDKLLLGHVCVLLSAENTSAGVPTRELLKEHYPHTEVRLNDDAAEDVSLLDTTQAGRVLGWKPKRRWEEFAE